MKKKEAGGRRQEVVTLADLAPRHRVSGGSARRVFGADPLTSSDSPGDTMAPKRDLPAKKEVKGGRIVRNDSLTLARAAEPTKRDLPASKDVKGGKVVRYDKLTLVRVR
jgi:hypothetical protein